MPLYHRSYTTREVARVQDKQRNHENNERCNDLIVSVYSEDDVFIGMQSLILKGLGLSREPLGREAVTIGRGSVVGAGSVVTWNVPAGVVVAGNPAVVVRQLEL